MSSLRDFLNWFEGFSENLDKAPTAKQWEKIKARILALREVADRTPEEGPAAPLPAAKPAEPGVDPDPRGTVIVQKWKHQALLALEEVYDAGDARKILDEKIVVDLNAEPAEVVRRFIAST